MPILGETIGGRAVDLAVKELVSKHIEESSLESSPMIIAESLESLKRVALAPHYDLSRTEVLAVAKSPSLTTETDPRGIRAAVREYCEYARRPFIRAATVRCPGRPIAHLVEIIRRGRQRRHG